ncbi:MAG: CBS domain-containing protein [Gammaproteobacteria bacterium]
MTRIRLEQTLTAPAPTAWSVVRDFSRLATFDPELAEATVSRGVGEQTVIRMVNHAGQVWEERCVDYQSGRSWTLACVDDSLPFPWRARQRQVSVVEQSADECQLNYELDYATRWGPIGALKVSASRQRALAQQTLEAMVHGVRDDQWRHTFTVQSILNRKGDRVVCAQPADSVGAVAGLLQANGIGAVLVMDGDDKLVGLVSERDITYGIARDGPELLEQPVESIMSTNLVVCSPQHDMEFVMLCMTDRRIRHLPVMDGETLKGIVSIGDVVLQRIAALESQSQTMREYIEAREWRYLQPATGDTDPLAQP